MSNLRILLAEDGPDNQVLLRAYFERLGARVTLVGDGKSAVAYALAEEVGERPFAIVFMDIDMPEMDGLTATRTLRAQGFTGPIVALTARAGEDDVRECLQAGCDEHLVKPTTIDALHAAIRRHARAAPRASGVMGRVLISEYAGDDEMLEIVRPFVKALPARTAAILGALDDGDMPAVKRLAHQLKGSAGGYGFPSITSAAAAIDKAVALGENPDKIRGRVEELTQLAAIARASVPPPSMRSEAFAGEPRRRDEEAGRAASA